MLITVGEAVAYVMSGMYGDVRELGAGNALLIIVQAHTPAGPRTRPMCNSNTSVGASSRVDTLSERPSKYRAAGPSVGC